jgi:acyl dehydratase
MSPPSAWAELVVGYQRPPYIAPPLTRTNFVRYQGASGDVNPAHHDDGFAQSAGFPGAFAPGMYAAGVMASYLCDWLGVANVRHFAVRFSDQAWPGESLTYTASVTGRDEGTDARRVELHALCTRPSGSVHLSAVATFVVP